MRKLAIVGLVAVLFAAAGSPALSISAANAAEKAGSHYCQNLPDSLKSSGFVPGICR
ncbi:MAG: hypothetical protein ACE5K9_06505 [Candidatus Methylomirabilales bacterium]